MRFRVLCVLVSLALFVGGLIGQETTVSSKPAVRMVEVEKDVSLEVLDWGGTGRPLVLLAGLGDDGHIFNDFAPKLTAKYHVYGIMRRGRGASSKPVPTDANYSADRLGEDVLAVINDLHLLMPVLAGHSLAGEELSCIGSTHPERVAGLIYLEAGYPYALYDQRHGQLDLDVIEFRKQLRPLINGYAFEAVKDYGGLIANLQRVEKELEQHQQETKGLPPSWVSPRMTPDLFAIMEGREEFTSIRTPALVIFATDPSPISGDDPKSHAEEVRQELLMAGKKYRSKLSNGRSPPLTSSSSRVRRIMYFSPTKPNFYVRWKRSSPHCHQRSSAQEHAPKGCVRPSVAGKFSEVAFSSVNMLGGAPAGKASATSHNRVCRDLCDYEAVAKRDSMSRKMQVLAAALACLISGTLTASATPAPAVSFVSVSPDVRIEVVDWGGSGPRLVLLAGSGDTAHIYDDFAPKLTNEFHVYGITRRGYGASSAPATGYSADRLGDDVVAVLDALHLSKPLLVGHSLAGEEISSIAIRHSSNSWGGVHGRRIAVRLPESGIPAASL